MGWGSQVLHNPPFSPLMTYIVTVTIHCCPYMPWQHIDDWDSYFLKISYRPYCKRPAWLRGGPQTSKLLCSLQIIKDNLPVAQIPCRTFCRLHPEQCTSPASSWLLDLLTTIQWIFHDNYLIPASSSSSNLGAQQKGKEHQNNQLVVRHLLISDSFVH